VVASFRCGRHRRSVRRLRDADSGGGSSAVIVCSEQIRVMERSGPCAAHAPLRRPHLLRTHYNCALIRRRCVTGDGATIVDAPTSKAGATRKTTPPQRPRPSPKTPNGCSTPASGPPSKTSASSSNPRLHRTRPGNPPARRSPPSWRSDFRSTTPNFYRTPQPATPLQSIGLCATLDPPLHPPSPPLRLPS